MCSAAFEFIAGRQRRFTGEAANLDCDSAYIVPRESIIYRDETVIFGGCVYEHFGHVLLDGLARTWYLPDAPKDLKIVFLMYPIKSQVPFEITKFIELMGIDTRRCEIITDPTQFRQVIVPDETIFPSDGYLPEYLRTFEQICKNIQPNNVKKLYLSRRKYNEIFTKNRLSINEEYYESFFERRGFTVIYPETLPLEEQIAYVMGADEIVTIMGTMAHLLLFAKSTAIATILNRTNNCIPAQLWCSQIRGLDVYYVDAFANPLPVNHTRGPFLFALTKYFKEYLDAREIEYELTELDVDKSAMKGFLTEFARNYKEELVESDWEIDDYLYAVYAVGQDYRYQMEKFKQQAAQNKKLANSRKKEIDKLRTRNQNLRAEIRRLRQSKSWKVTRPLRAVTKMIKKS